MFALAYDILVSGLGLLKSALIFSIIAFLAAVPAVKLRDFIKEKYSLEWVYSTFLTIFLFSLFFSFLIYFYFVLITPGVFSVEYPVGVAVDPMEELSRAVFFWLGVMLRRVAVALIFAILAYPFAFIGSLAQAYFSKKFISGYAALFFASFVACLVFFIIALFFDFLIPGLYYIFFYL